MTDIKRPCVSIGMPVYNGDTYIRQTLDALLSQTFTDFELIISDNASTDRTQDICLDYAAQDKRIRYHRNEIDKGSIWNFNQTFILSRGEYFVWISCHDVLESTYISRCVEVLEEESTVVLCYTLADCIDVDENFLNLIVRGPDTRGLDRASRCHVVLWGMQYAYPIHGIIRAEALKKTQLFSKIVGSDNILLFELSLIGEIAQIPEVLFHIRRLLDYGSWDAYISKIFGRSIKGLQRRWLFWGMSLEYLRVLNRHVSNMPARVFLMFSTLLCILVRYHWIGCGIAKIKQKEDSKNN